MTTCAQKNERIKLAEQRSTRYRIVIRRGCPISLVHAAEELRVYLNRITGAPFSIVCDDAKETEFEILVGKSSRFNENGYGIDFQALGEDAYRILTFGTKLIIAGNDMRGCLNGVYGFLEDFCGCRFFCEDEIHVPKRDTFFLPDIDETSAPAFEYRDSYFRPYNDNENQSRLRCNSFTLGELYGWGIIFKPFVHTFNQIIPPTDENFAAHPEYFSELNGKRTKDWSQLCLSNPEVLEIAKKKVREWIRENPETRVVSVSQNDWANGCTCEKCREIDEYEGSQSGTLIRFINAIADSIKDEFPDVSIDTLSYLHTDKPPAHVRPRPNVIVRLAPLGMCTSHPIEDCDCDYCVKLREKIQNWAAICDRLYIWDYTVNFHHTLAPYPNFHVLQPNIRYYLKNNVRGIFSEGNNSPRLGGEFNNLKQYIIAHLMWDPDFDVDHGVREFINAYYRSSAADVYDYFKLIHTLNFPDVHRRVGSLPAESYDFPEVWEKADKILTRAERLADDAVTLERVRRLHLSTRYVVLAFTPADTEGRREAAEEFIADCKQLGITSLREGVPFETSEKAFLAGEILN